MVEILRSLVFLVASAALASWPWVGLHDRTIDGLFLTLTGYVMLLLFLFNFIWQIRSQGAEQTLRIRNVGQKLTRACDAVLSIRGTGMRTTSPGAGIPFVLGIVLLILAFPSSLHASNLSLAQQTGVPGHSRQVLDLSVTHYSWVRESAPSRDLEGSLDSLQQ